MHRQQYLRITKILDVHNTNIFNRGIGGRDAASAYSTSCIFQQQLPQNNQRTVIHLHQSLKDYSHWSLWWCDVHNYAVALMAYIVTTRYTSDKKQSNEDNITV